MDVNIWILLAVPSSVTDADLTMVKGPVGRGRPDPRELPYVAVRDAGN